MEHVQKEALCNKMEKFNKDLKKYSNLVDWIRLSMKSIEKVQKQKTRLWPYGDHFRPFYFQVHFLYLAIRNGSYYFIYNKCFYNFNQSEFIILDGASII